MVFAVLGAIFAFRKNSAKPEVPQICSLDNIKECPVKCSLLKSKIAQLTPPLLLISKQAFAKFHNHLDISIYAWLEKAILGAFSVIVKLQTSRMFVSSSTPELLTVVPPKK